jgi:hypothetical protein
MRKILKEYQWDWQLWCALKSMEGMPRGTANEIQTMLKFMPQDMQEQMEIAFSNGKPGELLRKASRQYFENILNAHKKDEKIALMTYNFSPTICFAMGINPLPLEMFSAAIHDVFGKGATGESLDYCTEIGFPETACSGQRTGLGPILAGLTEKPDMVLYSTAGVCDSNAAAYAFAAEYLNLPGFQINYPPVLVSDETDEYQLNDFKAMLAFLEEQTGRSADEEKFRQVCREINEQDKLLTEIQDYYTIVPNPIPVASNITLYFTHFFFKGLPIGSEIMREMLNDAKENAKKGLSGSGCEKVRGLWNYIDHYSDNGRYHGELAKRGIVNVGCMLSEFWQSDAPISRGGKEAECYGEIDLTDLDSMIFGLMGQTSRLPMVKQIRGPYDEPAMWLEDTISAIKLFKAEFTVFMGTMGCRNTWGMVKPFARELEKAGIPTLILYSDSFDSRAESTEKMLDKTMEFIEIRGLLNK